VNFLAKRQREEEWMDRDDVDPVLLQKSLKFIRRINRLLGYTRATLSHLNRFSRRWNPDEPISMIDFATGSADVPLAILRWADARKFNVRVTGVDLHAATVHEARQASHDPRLSIVRADVLKLPFEPRSFDYAICGMFLHHLSEAQAVGVLVEMDRVARRGLIAADLLRDRRAYQWIKFFTLLSNPMVKHDGRVSVQQAFSADEAKALAQQARLNYLIYHRHFAHRFILAGEKV
jgi:ubiquinone/menaquinone biosynthesis C-methylase UbiE